MKKILERLVNSFILFNNINEVEKYFEVIEEKPEGKIMIQSRSFDNSVRVFSVEILNLFDPELKLINGKPIIRNKFKSL